METKDFYYDLPEELIAQTPVSKRDESRMMVINREDETIIHDTFYDIINYIEPGDLVILNNTKVSPVRLFGHRPGKEERVQLLLLKEVEAKVWQGLVQPGKKARIGDHLIFSDRLSADIIDTDEEGNRFAKLNYEGNLYEILDEIGEMPLPPYIHQKLEEKERYQTVYAKWKGSAAAPTAGLHFTEEILTQLKAKGVNIASVLLHIGLGTFRPVKEERIEDHTMHAEYYELTEETAELIRETKAQGKRVICVGTTVVRTLESVYQKHGEIKASSGWTDIFIYPGFTYHVTDALLTNFHLPESTLLMLVSALAGREFILRAYREAVEERYRFFSLGDCMLIL